MDSNRLRKILKGLRGWRAKTRKHAAEFLAQYADRFSDADDIPMLLRALSDALEDRQAVVRELAAKALTGLGVKARPALPGLLRALEAEEIGDEGAEAVRALGTPGIQALARMFRSPNVRLKRRAAHGLWLPHGFAETIEPEVIAEAARALIEALASQDVELRRHAASGLRWYEAHAAPAVPRLLEATRDGDAEIRVQAAQTLAYMPPNAAGTLEPAIRLLHEDPDARVSEGAFDALGFVGKRAAPAAPAIIPFLIHPEEDFRAKGKLALEGIGPLAIPALVDWFERGDVAMRRAVAETLGALPRSSL